MVYTHISDQYALFYPNLVNVSVRDSAYVLGGLLYHESDLCIQEHYTDTNGFTNHVFARMHLRGFRFAPRIGDLVDIKLYVHGNPKDYPAFAAMIGDTYNEKHIQRNLDEVLRPAPSIRKGTVAASLMLRKPDGSPRQNGLAVTLREFGRVERTLVILDWLQNVESRWRVHAGLNKGEARNALARSAFFLPPRGNPRSRFRGALTWSSPQSCCGTPSAVSGPFMQWSHAAGRPTQRWCPISRHLAGSTSI